MRHLLGPLALLGALSTTACAPQPPGELIRSSKSRLAVSGVPAEDIQTASRDMADFGLAMYREVRKEEAGNLVLSPMSLSTALVMTSAGARGQTLAGMEQALHLSLPQERLHAAYNALDQALASRGASAKKDFSLASVNTLWTQRGFGFEASFLDTLALHYDAGVRAVDFVRDAEGARQGINAWVEAQTHERIQELIPAGVLGSDTRLVLTNAVYFKAAWARPFLAAHTQVKPFQLRDGSTKQVQTMALTAPLRYAEHEGLQAVELPYEGEELSMLAILPAEGGFAEAEATLDGARLQALVGALEVRQVGVSLPRFTFTTEAGAADALKRLGMEEAFGGGADFSGITSEESLSIRDVLHQAFLAVDEAGTEAAAATAVVMERTSGPAPAEVLFEADRPFFFLIRDTATGAVLFLGAVVDP